MWEPIGNGKQRCNAHGREFPIGHHCPAGEDCRHPGDGTPAKTAAQLMAEEARRRELGGSLDREQALLEIAKEERDYARMLRTDADAFFKEARKADKTAADRKAARDAGLELVRTSHHLVETARKCIKDAGDFTIVREEAADTEDLERAAGELDKETN